MTKVCVIGDAHVDELQALDRFKAAGSCIRRAGVEKVIVIGDFLSLNCFSEWDRNKRKKMEGRRWSKETAAGNKALDLLNLPDDVEKIFIEGNHEERARRFVDLNPEVDDICVRSKLSLDDRGWKWVPYREAYNFNGVSFTHIPLNAAGKPIGNPNVCTKALQVYHTSVVFGHTHTLDIAGVHRKNSPHLQQALAVGCFFEHVDEYAQGSLTNYWRGLVFLDMYSRARFDIATLSMRQVYEHGKA